MSTLDDTRNGKLVSLQDNFGSCFFFFYEMMINDKSSLSTSTKKHIIFLTELSEGGCTTQNQGYKVNRDKILCFTTTSVVVRLQASLQIKNKNSKSRLKKSQKQKAISCSVNRDVAVSLVRYVHFYSSFVCPIL